MYGITINLDLGIHPSLDRDRPANRRSVARKAAHEQRFEEHTTMNIDPTIQHMVATKLHAESLAKAERARIIAEARTQRPSAFVRVRQFTGVMLIRAGERLGGTQRTAAGDTAPSVPSVDALRIAR